MKELCYRLRVWISQVFNRLVQASTITTSTCDTVLPSVADTVFIQPDANRHHRANKTHYWVDCNFQGKNFFIRLTEWEFERGKLLALKNPEDAPEHR